MQRERRARLEWPEAAGRQAAVAAEATVAAVASVVAVAVEAACPVSALLSDSDVPRVSEAEVGEVGEK